jgi:hypothetical protein
MTISVNVLRIIRIVQLSVWTGTRQKKRKKGKREKTKNEKKPRDRDNEKVFVAFFIICFSGTLHFIIFWFRSHNIISGGK